MSRIKKKSPKVNADHQDKLIRIRSVDCPLCGADDKEPLYRDMCDVEDGIAGRYTISRCKKCGIIYLSVRPTRKSLPQCYHHDYHVRVEGGTGTVAKFIYKLKHFMEYRQLMQTIGHVPKSLLDIGCGSGGFLWELHRQWGSGCRLSGIELASPTTVDFPKTGIDFLIGNIEKLRPVRKYEIVTMYELLDHVYDPVKALHAASKWLVDGGFLIGKVPHFNSPWRKVFPRHWDGFQISRHMTFFDDITIRKVLSNDFEVLSVSNHFDPGDLGVSLCNWIVSSLSPGTRPRQSFIYLPLMILTAPISLFMVKVLRAPCNLVFTAVKRT